MKNFCEDLFFFFFFGDRLKNFCEDLFFFFFLESTCALCPWSLALASSIPVLGLESVCPRKGCPWPWPWPRIFFVSLALALASSLVSSTPPLGTTPRKNYLKTFQNSQDNNERLPIAVTPKKIKVALQSTEPNKAAGTDGTYPEMLKTSAQKPLLELLNVTDIIDTGKLPSNWKIANVIGILKPRKPPKNSLSYQSIILLTCFLSVVVWIERPISGRVDRASATEAVDTGSIPGRVKPKTIKIGIHSFPA